MIQQPSAIEPAANAEPRSKFRRRQHGTLAAENTVEYTLNQCSLGWLLVAKSKRGVCAISLGDETDALEHELRDRFPTAKSTRTDSGFDQLLTRVTGFIEAPTSGFELPLDIDGTVFQRRVWEALQTIPPGEILTYSELAQRLGAPKASRAVAGACAANSLAVVIPCHRVVRSNGELSGYRWGVQRKRTLLDRERTITQELLV